MAHPEFPRNCALVVLPAPVEDVAGEAAAGLAGNPRTLPCKLFYDHLGCQLFEAICGTPEYYLRRSEAAIFQRHAAAIARCIGPVAGIIEPGAGGCEKVVPLLDRLQPASYLPLDLAEVSLAPSAALLARRFPGVSVQAVVMDFVRDLEEVARWLPRGGRRLLFYPGSSIGNFAPDEAVALLRRFAGVAGRDGGLLIGFDAKKSAVRLHAAYNDAAGLTARFNLNLLERLNRDYDAGFDLAAFEHYAIYRPDLGRIEMHLLCHRHHRVRLAGREFAIGAGETLHTENSYKYRAEEFDALAARAGWTIQAGWSDEAGDFCLRYYAAEVASGIPAGANP
jgi:L-histidine Nalpha-methyltransferase